MRAAVYARVSKAEDQTPENQLLTLREYCKQRGWTVAFEYVDEASATDLRGRKAWRELLQQVRLGGFDVVLTARLDRAFRSSKDTFDTLSYLDAHRIGFVTASQDIDTTSATGKLLLGILAAVSEFELNLIRERTKDGLRRAVAQGKRLGRPPGAKDKRKRAKAGYYQRWAE